MSKVAHWEQFVQIHQVITWEQICEPVKAIDELVKLADDLWVIATKYSADIVSSMVFSEIESPLWAIDGES